MTSRDLAARVMQVCVLLRRIDPAARIRTASVRGGRAVIHAETTAAAPPLADIHIYTTRPRRRRSHK